MNRGAWRVHVILEPCEVLRVDETRVEHAHRLKNLLVLFVSFYKHFQLTERLPLVPDLVDDTVYCGQIGRVFNVGEHFFFRDVFVNLVEVVGLKQLD